jgi:oligopeptide/dipeptide ABC transporter ATP-binding protein
MLEPVRNATAPDPLLTVRNLSKSYPVTRSGLLRKKVVGTIDAVKDVSFSVDAGETLSIVGESGCGKTTTARSILNLVAPTSGEIQYQGRDVVRTFETGERGDVLALRRQMQYVFQDPYLSLNPRWSIRQILREPLRIHRRGEPASRDGQIEHLLARVGLPASYADRYPHEFSGGQRQRIGIARALAVEPQLLICDEPVSSLDMSVRAQILNLLADLQDDLGLSYLYISHDLGSVRFLSQRVAVMYLGTIVEIGDVDAIFDRPRHHYTAALLSAIPVPDPMRSATAKGVCGEAPSVTERPRGCPFHTRCPAALPVCRDEMPALVQSELDHKVACHNPR